MTDHTALVLRTQLRLDEVVIDLLSHGFTPDLAIAFLIDELDGLESEMESGDLKAGMQ